MSGKGVKKIKNPEKKRARVKRDRKKIDRVLVADCMIDRIGQKGEMSRALDRLFQLALLVACGARHATRDHFSLLCQKLIQESCVLVIHHKVFFLPKTVLSFGKNFCISFDHIVLVFKN